MFDLIESPDAATRRALIALSVRYGRSWEIAEALAEAVAVARQQPKLPLAALPAPVRQLYLELARRAYDDALDVPSWR
jgi:hypothetical protein